ncbi:MAG: dienelactone hydrolase family protein [Rhodospirillaceae bacterium]|nr:dienelactone hydrolase family protein [Rhodospirillaceae bacterium]
MTVQEETLALEASDGFQLEGFVARATGQAKGGLVVLQEIFGVTDQLKAVARSYAEDGYDAIVPAMFDRALPHTVVPFDTPDRGRDIALNLDPEKVLLDVQAAMATVDGGSGVSIIGFCWGGGQAMRLACTLDLACSIAFYGTALEKHLANNPGGPKCPMLFHFGDTDDHSPAHVIDAVRDAIPAAAVEIYPAGHAFANDARSTYVEAAAASARQRTLEFLNQHHGD